MSTKKYIDWFHLLTDECGSVCGQIQPKRRLQDGATGAHRCATPAPTNWKCYCACSSFAWQMDKCRKGVIMAVSGCWSTVPGSTAWPSLLSVTWPKPEVSPSRLTFLLLPPPLPSDIRYLRSFGASIFLFTRFFNQSMYFYWTRSYFLSKIKNKGYLFRAS